MTNRVGPTFVTLIVAGLERQVEFYRDALGLAVLHQEDGRARMGDPGATDGDGGARETRGPGAEFLELVEVPHCRPAPRATGLFHLALLHPSRASLARAMRRLERNGVPLQGASDHLVSEALYLSDPEGNGVELYCDRPRDAWPWDGDSIRMATLPLDLGALISAADDGMPTRGRVRLGHVHLRVAGIEAAERFFREGVGLDLMARYGQQASFLAADGYHHHIGVNVWSTLGSPPPDEGSAGLGRYGFALASPERVEEAARRIRELGWRVTRSGETVAAAEPAGTELVLSAVRRNGSTIS